MNSVAKDKKGPSKDIPTLRKEILDIELSLGSHIPTTLWITDLHGEGQRFVNILRGRFGLIYKTCRDALPQTLGIRNIDYLSRVLRKASFFPEPGINMSKQDVILCLVDILKYKVGNRHYNLRIILKGEMEDVIIRMLKDKGVPDIVFENDMFSDRLILELSQAIKRVALNHLVVLGDILDRGGEPDTIIRILKSKEFRNDMTLIYGNHDVLWMGAVAGNCSLIAEAMRITCRYDHMPFLQRMGIDVSKLLKFALKTYPSESIKGKFKAKTPEAKSMEKALAIIQFKLEEATIRRHPEFEMDGRLWLEKLAAMLSKGDTESLTDTDFPTIDLKKPLELSKEEKMIIDDLAQQFKTSKKLKEYIGFFFTHGKHYQINNDFLNIHALIPSNAEGDFETVLGLKGKALLDHVQGVVDRVGVAYLNEQPQNEADLALFFYLWCGPKSPLFGKDAMKTFERYFFSDKATHKETILYWEKNLNNPKFQELIKKEFGVSKVIFGHEPKDVSKGQKMNLAGDFAINVDGGFAAAYYNRGHALVRTPTQLYGIVLPTPEEMEEANRNKSPAPISIQIIEVYKKPVKNRDTQYGQELSVRKSELLEQLTELISRGK